ncbi:MAG TPA: sialate O-acetylesterase, partial [Armatimonadota bacterium]
MTIALRIRILLYALLLTVGAVTAFAQGGAEAKPFLHPLFADHMVLQRDIAAPVWGWTTPGTKVTISMGDKTGSARADADGKWLAKIGPFPAGGPYNLTVAGPQTVTVQDVLVGDVWVCSGQSNMQMGINLVSNAKEEVAQADHPNIRLCLVTPTIGLVPKGTVVNKWSVCTPEAVASGGWGGFSAAGYFFGRELEQQLKIPIGLIDASWGGTVAQAWTSKEGLADLHDFDNGVKLVGEMGADQPAYIARIAKGLQDWWALDPGTTGSWGEKADLDTSAWKSMTLPGNWEATALPNYNGAVWFSKTVELSQEWAGKQLMLHLGVVDDRDVTYFNGVRVGGSDNNRQA